jgi:hypothetical protein
VLAAAAFVLVFVSSSRVVIPYRASSSFSIRTNSLALGSKLVQKPKCKHALSVMTTPAVIALFALLNPAVPAWVVPAWFCKRPSMLNNAQHKRLIDRRSLGF